jgi:hypothetical protein
MPRVALYGLNLAPGMEWPPEPFELFELAV